MSSPPSVTCTLKLLSLVILAKTMMHLPRGFSQRISSDLLSSPCPQTFQYFTDGDGDIYGKIGVYSLDQTIIKLNVQMSVGNSVDDNYNGEIQLAQSKPEASQNIRNRQPVRYKLFFPKWRGHPPKITKILVNNQLVCQGPPLKLGFGIRVVTTVNLQHTLSIGKIDTLQSNLFLPELITTTKLPFNINSNKNNEDISVIFHPEIPEIDVDDATFIQNPFLSINSIPKRTTTTKYTTSTERLHTNSIPTTDYLYSKNPFLGGDALPTLHQHPPRRPSASTTPFPPRRRITTTTSAPPRRTFPPEVIHRDQDRQQRPYSDICGISQVSNPLVVKGHSVKEQAFPWLVALFHVVSTGLDYQCSGSLVSKKHVVTAGHCVKHREGHNFDPSKVLLVLGKLNLQIWSTSSYERMVTAEEINVHPEYTLSDSDLAVIVLSEQINRFSDYIRPICLWDEPRNDLRDVVGEKGIVVGWGQDENGNVRTAEPKQIALPIVSDEVCLRSANQFQYVTSNRTFCAGERNGAGPCNGDSGSGFIMKRGDRWVLRGVVSTSLKLQENNKAVCDLTNYVIFTDASKFTAWILSFL